MSWYLQPILMMAISIASGFGCMAVIDWIWPLTEEDKEEEDDA